MLLDKNKLLAAKQFRVTVGALNVFNVVILVECDDVPVARIQPADGASAPWRIAITSSRLRHGVPQGTHAVCGDADQISLDRNPVVS